MRWRGYKRFSNTAIDAAGTTHSIHLDSISLLFCVLHIIKEVVNIEEKKDERSAAAVAVNVVSLFPQQVCKLKIFHYCKTNTIAVNGNIKQLSY